MDKSLPSSSASFASSGTVEGLLSLSSPRSGIFRAQLVDKEIEIMSLKDQIVKMYSKMTTLEAENELLRKRTVVLEKGLEETSIHQPKLSAKEKEGDGGGGGLLLPSMQQEYEAKIERLEKEVQTLKDQNMQLKTTLKSILNS